CALITMNQGEPQLDIKSLSRWIPGHQSSLLVRYGLVLLLLAAAVGVRYLLTPWIADYHPFMFFAPVAFIATWLGGWGPGLAALLAGIVVGDFVLIPPVLYRLHPYTPLQIAVITVHYCIATGIGIALIEALHRLRHRAQVSAEEAKVRGERLERALKE